VTFRIHPRLAFALATSIPVVAVAAVIWVVVWATHYAPLGDGSLSSRMGPHGTMIKAALGSDGRDVLYVDARRGSTFRMAFSIRNGGDHTITLLGVPNPGQTGSAGLFPVLSASIGPHDLNMDGPGDHLGGGHYPRQFHTLTPSRTASLHAGDDRLVYFTMRVNGHCLGRVAHNANRASVVSSVDSIPVRYRVLGLFTRTQQIPLPYNLALACRGSGVAVP
jgi:hypothetical protein